jgi:hypothetical protein
VHGKEARELGRQVMQTLLRGDCLKAQSLLAPSLDQRIPFSSLDRIGAATGRAPVAQVNDLVQLLATDHTMGGWVVIGGCLGQQLDRDLAGALDRCRGLIVQGAKWYVTDILAERVPGPALLREFSVTLDLLEPWVADENPWVRRALGVAVHHWGKRSRGAVSEVHHAEALLGFIEPLFSEWDWDAVKGIALGLKTIGRFYPEVMTDWLLRQVVFYRKRHRAWMVRKALTYLSPSQTARALGKDTHEA